MNLIDFNIDEEKMFYTYFIEKLCRGKPSTVEKDPKNWKLLYIIFMFKQISCKLAQNQHLQ